MSVMSQRAYLKKLKEEDPDFYATLIANKKSLNIKELDNDSDTEKRSKSKKKSKLSKKGAVSINKNELKDRNVSSEKCDIKNESERQDIQDDDLDEPYTIGGAHSQNEISRDLNEDACSSEGEGSHDTDESVESEEDQEDDLNTSKKKSVVLTPELVKQWVEELQSNSPYKAFKNVCLGLVAAIDSINCSAPKNSVNKFIVQSPNVYNQLVHAALLYMGPAVQRLLNVRNLAHITSSWKFKRYGSTIKMYLQALLKLYDHTLEPSQRAAVLRRGILPLISVFKVQPKQGRLFLKKLVEVWATGHPKVRVIAFVGIFRLIKFMGRELLEYTVKNMYLQYVQNCRFTSKSSLGCICFMRLCLSELYSLDHALAYQHAFLYIRQMAFHLRNAIMANKEEKLRLVYNWQFVHSLHLWSSLLASTHPSPVLEPLIYPVVQLALGTVRLQDNSLRYTPLALRVSAMLTDLADSTGGIFIPVLPVLIKALSNLLTSKSISSTKQLKKELPLWECTLKLTDSESCSGTVLQALVQQCVLGIVRYLAVHASNIAFPDLVVPVLRMLKEFEKKKEQACQGLLKQLYARIVEHAEFIEMRRQDVTFQLKDRKQVLDWEIATKQLSNLPILTYCEKLQKQLAADEDEEEDELQSKAKRTFEKQKNEQDTGKRKRNEETEAIPNKKPKVKVRFDVEAVRAAQESVRKLTLADLAVNKQ